MQSSTAIYYIVVLVRSFRFLFHYPYITLHYPNIVPNIQTQLFEGRVVKPAVMDSVQTVSCNWGLQTAAANPDNP